MYDEFYHSNELVAVGSRTDGTYVMFMRVIIPVCPAEKSTAVLNLKCCSCGMSA